MDYSQAICDIYRHFKDCNPTKERKVLIVFGDIIADVESNKKLKPIVTKLFIAGRQLNISHVFITQSYFTKPKKNMTKCNAVFIMKIPNKRLY